MPRLVQTILSFEPQERSGGGHAAFLRAPGAWSARPVTTALGPDRKHRMHDHVHVVVAIRAKLTLKVEQSGMVCWFASRSIL